MDITATTDTSGLPKDYLHAVFKAPGQPLVLERTPLVLPEPGQLLIKAEACGVCHSDVFARDNTWGSGFPRVPGHEIVGRVAAVATGETQWHVGDRIGGAWHGYHDGTCKACKKGLYQMCEKEVINGVQKDGGCAFPLYLAFWPWPRHTPIPPLTPTGALSTLISFPPFSLCPS